MKKMIILLILSILSSCSENESSTENILDFSLKWEDESYQYQDLNKMSDDISRNEIKTIVEKKFNVKYETNYGNKSVLSTIGLLNFKKITKISSKDSNKILYIGQNGSTVTVVSCLNDGKKIIILDKSTIRDINEYYYNLNENHNSHYANTTNQTRSVCQRQAGETQSECEDREYDEFVDGCFQCWVAYWTHPPIAIMISAFCLCQEP